MLEHPSQVEKDPKGFGFQPAAHKVLGFKVFFRIGIFFFFIQRVQLVRSQENKISSLKSSKIKMFCFQAVQVRETQLSLKLHTLQLLSLQ